MKRLALVFALLLLLSLAIPCLAADAILFMDAPGQTLYVRVFTGATTSVAAAMTEGTGNGVGRYVVTDATLVSAGLSGGSAVAPVAYPYKIFAGSPSTSANDPLVGVGSEPLYWASTAATTRLAAEFVSNFLTAAKASTDFIAEVADAVEEFTEASVPVNQVPVPASRTWTLTDTAEGLKDTTERTLRVGDTRVFAIDFRNALPTNGRLEDMTSVAIDTGTNGGVTFANTDTDPGVDKTQGKVSITAVSAGDYTLEVNVAIPEQFGGGTETGIVTLTVTQ